MEPPAANVGRLIGSFVVTSIQDVAGAELFVHQKGGGFRRLATAPSFAGAVHEAGYGEALSSTLY